MFAFLARWALGAATIGGLALGALTLGSMPAKAVTCGISFTPTTGSPISDCSEIITFTGTSPSNLTFTVTTPSNGSPYAGTDGYGAYNVSGYTLIGVINNSSVTIPDLYIGGGIGQALFSLQPLENLCAGAFTPGLSLTCSAAANSGTNGTIFNTSSLTEFTGANLTYLTGAGACTGVSAAVLSCEGDVSFVTSATPSGLPNGDTAIFALTDATCLQDPASQGAAVSSALSRAQRRDLSARARLARGVRHRPSWLCPLSPPPARRGSTLNRIIPTQSSIPGRPS